MGMLSRLLGGAMAGEGQNGMLGLLPMLMQRQGDHGGEGQQQQQQPGMMGRLGNLATDPMFQHNMQMAMTGESQGVPPPRMGGEPFPTMRPPMMNPGGGIGGGLQPPQMPPGQGGMGALMGGFSTSPEFQNQLGAIHGGTSPGRMPVQFTPPQTPVPPMNVNTGNTRGGRSIAGVPISGPGGLRDGMGGYTGQAPSAGLHHDAFRYLRGL
jgi:hypothetical protein